MRPGVIVLCQPLCHCVSRYVTVSSLQTQEQFPGASRDWNGVYLGTPIAGIRVHRQSYIRVLTSTCLATDNEPT